MYTSHTFEHCSRASVQNPLTMVPLATKGMTSNILTKAVSPTPFLITDGTC